MFSKCPKTSFGLAISSNNDLTFCQNPGNDSLIIPLAAHFLSCVFLFLYAFLLSLTSFSSLESALYFFPWSLPNPFGGHWSRTKEGKWQHLQPFPITVPLPLGCLLHTNLITCLTAQLWTTCVCLVQGSWGALCFTARCSREWWLFCWGREWWTLRDLPPQIQAVTSWLSSAALAVVVVVFFPRWGLPFRSHESSPLFSQNFKIFP